MGSWVYLAETYRTRIHRYPIRSYCTVGGREDIAPLSGEHGPNGMAVDEEGNLYFAHFGGARVAIFSSSREMVEEIPVPGALGSNVAFGGPDRRTLVVTDVETASLYQTRIEVPSLPLFGQTVATEWHGGGSISERGKRIGDDWHPGSQPSVTDWLIIRTSSVVVRRAGETSEPGHARGP